VKLGYLIGILALFGGIIFLGVKALFAEQKSVTKKHLKKV
jgi:hypothetical protein